MSESPEQGFTNKQTIIFMVVLSVVCAAILSILASALKEPQEIAKELDRSKQMMIAAKILSHPGYFLIQNKEGKYVPAKADSSGVLTESTAKEPASQSQLLEVYKKRFNPLVVNNQGEIKTFKEANLDEEKYIVNFKKSGYYRQPWKLIYEILPNSDSQKEEVEKPIGYIIPINGYGLWDAIYGFLAIKPDGNTVIGISWYDQKETPGLGANITEESWQDLFPNKRIFQRSADGETDFKSASLGITVVKGKVVDTLGDSPKADSAVDGMTGATLTGNGVTDAYRDVLAAYRPLLIKLQQTPKQ